MGQRPFSKKKNLDKTLSLHLNVKKMKKIMILNISRCMAILFIFGAMSCSFSPFKNWYAQKKESKPEEIKAPVIIPEKKIEEVTEFKKMVLSDALSSYCEKVDQNFKRLDWGNSHCENIEWMHVRNSVQGDPLIWAVFGDEDKQNNNPNDTTMILCGVHGDEITPIKFCFDVILNLVKNYKKLYSDRLIIVAPIVNPDSFFAERPSRTNFRNIDINRNFPTRDWNAKALKYWNHRYKKDKRRYPGESPMSEPEVVFQVNLIKRYSPTKIISVHAPMTMLDYDGPSLQRFESSLGNKANSLLKSMSKEAKDYKISNYPFFPGSLGNWAGNEHGIPTYTLELPSSDGRKHKEYWDLFKGAIHAAFLKDFRDNYLAKEN